MKSKISFFWKIVFFWKSKISVFQNFRFSRIGFPVFHLDFFEKKWFFTFSENLDFSKCNYFQWDSFGRLLGDLEISSNPQFFREILYITRDIVFFLNRVKKYGPGKKNVCFFKDILDIPAHLRSDHDIYIYIYIYHGQILGQPGYQWKG